MIHIIFRINTRSPIIIRVIKSHPPMFWSAVTPPEARFIHFALVFPSPPLILVHSVKPPHHGVDGIKSLHNFSQQRGATISLLCGLLSQSLLSFGVV